MMQNFNIYKSSYGFGPIGPNPYKKENHPEDLYERIQDFITIGNIKTFELFLNEHSIDLNNHKVYVDYLPDFETHELEKGVLLKNAIFMFSCCSNNYEILLWILEKTSFTIDEIKRKNNFFFGFVLTMVI
jgi:hypothetical protein